MGDKTECVIRISFKSSKAKKVTRSTMSGEVIVFCDLFDVAAVLSAGHKVLVSFTVPI